mgnify:CR=1 FL=1
MRLRNTIDNSILSEEIIIKDTVNCDYVVYIDEYESPFKELDNNNINANEIYAELMCKKVTCGLNTQEEELLNYLEK